MSFSVFNESGMVKTVGKRFSRTDVSTGVREGAVDEGPGNFVSSIEGGKIGGERDWLRPRLEIKIIER